MFTLLLSRLLVSLLISSSRFFPSFSLFVFPSSLGFHRVYLLQPPPRNFRLEDSITRRVSPMKRPAAFLINSAEIYMTFVGSRFSARSQPFTVFSRVNQRCLRKSGINHASLFVLVPRGFSPVLRFFQLERGCELELPVQRMYLSNRGFPGVSSRKGIRYGVRINW